MASEDARKLFVAGLPDSATEEVLRGLFSESGAQVTELTLPRDRMSGRPRGFAFVRLGSQEDADRARQVLDGRIVDGKAISVRPFQAEPPAKGEASPRGGSANGERGSYDRGGDRASADRGAFNGGSGPSSDRGGFGPPRGGFGAGGNAGDRTLYVGNLPYDATQEEIENLMRDCSVEPVLRVHLPVDQDGRKRGFGFVTLGSAEVAKTALDNLKNADLRGRRLNINIAHPKEAAGGAGAGAPRPHNDAPMGDRPPRVFSGPPSGGNSFGGPPSGGNGFGPPAPPGGLKAADLARRKKTADRDGAAEGRARAAAGKREREERWRDQDDDE